MNETLIPRSGPTGRRGEPLSLAEVLAFERSRGVEPIGEQEFFDRIDYPGAATHLADLQKMTVSELIAEARRSQLDQVESDSFLNNDRCDLINQLIRYRIREHGMIFAEGTLEILPDEFGFLRVPEYQYRSCPDDIYISPNQIRRFGLRPGCIVSGQVRPPKENERYFALLRVESVNGADPNLLTSKLWFEELTPEYPNRRIVLESEIGGLSSRLIDLLVPVGFGQRGLIVSPPGTGKTVLMQKMAQSVLANYPEVYVFVVLIDERPEEVTEMQRQLKGEQFEMVASTFDETPTRHLQVAEIILEKAKRMVEYGRDVIIFLDSITRLTRAWNAEISMDGNHDGDKLHNESLQAVKRFFGSARKIADGGSLTLLATASVATGAALDEAIFENFKGTGNLEIHLDPQLVEKRIWPAIDIARSSTRREEMLFTPEEHRKICILRRRVAEMDSTKAMEFLQARLANTESNHQYLQEL